VLAAKVRDQDHRSGRATPLQREVQVHPRWEKTKCRAALLPLEAPEEKYSEGATLAAVHCVRKHVSADALGVADPTRTAGRGR